MMHEEQPYREFLQVLACPVCRGELCDSGDELLCLGCGLVFPIRHGVPLLLPEPGPVEERPADHMSNVLPSDVVRLLESTPGYTLNVGGGATPKRFPRCVELEGAIFRNTTVVGDATCMPLADDAFDLVVSLNLFEHVHDPWRAASEVFRVLRPGGTVFIHTAFLQPLHADPFHYYNATEQGVRRWFQAFEIDSCSVSDNFSPGYVFGWLASDLLWLAGQELDARTLRALEGMTLASLSQYWRDPSTRTGACWEAFRRLSQGAQARLAGGFQLIGRKPQR
jgi:SAM-dependent methyltransferase